MGIKHSEGKGNLVFLNVQKGALMKGREALDAGTSVEGILKKFTLKAESFVHNGSDIHKEVLSLRLADTDPTQPDIVVSFTFANGGNGADVPGDASYTALRTLGKLNVADLSQPIEIMPWAVKQGKRMGDRIADRDMDGIAIRQGSVSIAGEDYGKGLDRLPDLEVVMGANGKPLVVQGKELKDRSDWNTIGDNLLSILAERLPEMNKATESNADVGIDPADVADVAAAAEAAVSAAPTAPAANRSTQRARA